MPASAGFAGNTYMPANETAQHGGARMERDNMELIERDKPKTINRSGIYIYNLKPYFSMINIEIYKLVIRLRDNNICSVLWFIVTTHWPLLNIF